MAEERERARRGRFLVIDGVDGCGKTTQAELLARELGVKPDLHLREPGSTPLGEELRLLLLHRDWDVHPAAEVLLFAAARRQMLEHLVRPALERGETVVCERFNPSTYAYQAVAGDLDPEAVLRLLEEWCGDPSPDLVVILDLEVDEAAARRGNATDRIEAKGLAFQRRVAEGYRRFAAAAPRAVRIDGSGEPALVHAAVMAEVNRVG